MSKSTSKPSVQKGTLGNKSSKSFRTPPVVRAKVLAKRAAGKSMNEIHKEVGIHRKTVKRICTDAEAGEFVEQLKRDYVMIGQSAVETVHFHVKKRKDLSTSFRVLRNLGIHSDPGEGNGAQMPFNPAVSVNVNQDGRTQINNEWVRQGLDHVANLASDFGMELPKIAGGNGNKKRAE